VAAAGATATKHLSDAALIASTQMLVTVLFVYQGLQHQMPVAWTAVRAVGLQPTSKPQSFVERRLWLHFCCCCCCILCCCSGTLDAELQEGDTVLFISTLHGG
jgi:hypothetical protein